MQEKEHAQENEELIVIQDMEVGPKLLSQDVDLMLSTQQIIIQSISPLTGEQAPREEDEIVPIEDCSIMDMYNLTYDELQNKIVKVRNKHFPDGLTSLAFIRERVILTNTKRNLESIVAAKLAFTDATKSNMQYLMAKNKQMEKNLHDARKPTEQLQAEFQKAPPTQVYLEELKASLLGEVLVLGENMLRLYEELVTIHKAIVFLHGMQQKCKDNAKHCFCA